MNTRDEELSKRLAATLDNSVAALDADTRARLATLRQTALTRNHNRRVYGGLALAASLVALILVPRLLQQAEPGLHPVEPGLSQEVAVMNGNDMAYLSVDPQLLDDMDMLQAMDELQGDEGAAPATDNSRGES